MRKKLVDSHEETNRIEIDRALEFRMGMGNEMELTICDPEN